MFLFTEPVNKAIVSGFDIPEVRTNSSVAKQGIREQYKKTYLVAPEGLFPRKITHISFLCGYIPRKNVKGERSGKGFQEIIDTLFKNIPFKPWKSYRLKSVKMIKNRYW